MQNQRSLYLYKRIIVMYAQGRCHAHRHGAQVANPGWCQLPIRLSASLGHPKLLGGVVIPNDHHGEYSGKWHMIMIMGILMILKICMMFDDYDDADDCADRCHGNYSGTYHRSDCVWWECLHLFDRWSGWWMSDWWIDCVIAWLIDWLMDWIGLDWIGLDWLIDWLITTTP